ncbi:hypothetical protein [Bradyrhizobium sp. AZCC 2262]|uniref:hypothetical protein n=1 Tax=Bradyrhizobium sp. AZCC 2262 TaxID=3117022 RepID=UPI002FEFD8CF
MHRTVFGEQSLHPAECEALRMRRVALEAVEDDQARLGRGGQNVAKRMNNTDIAFERGFRVVVDRGFGEPQAPAVIALANPLRQRGLPASGLANEKARAAPIEAVEHFGARVIARQRRQAGNPAANIGHKLAARAVEGFPIVPIVRMVAQIELATQLSKHARKVERSAGPFGVRNGNEAGPEALGLFGIARPQNILAIAKRVVMIARRRGLEVEPHQSHLAKELHRRGIAGVAFVAKRIGAPQAVE